MNLVMNHIITAQTPLDPDMLKFRSLVGEETLSSLYEFKVELVSPSASVDMNGLLGKPLTLEIVALNGAVRHLGGYIARCAFMGRETHTPRTYVYAVTLRPWLWFLTQTTDCHIFQNLSAVEILRQVFNKYGFQVDDRLLASYRKWDYCVQYQESDFSFVSRLMEQEGIYYYFRHEARQQVLVLADDMSAHDPLPGYATLPYLPPDRLALPGDEGVDQWHPAEELSPGAYAIDDYDFRKPQADLSQVRANPLSADHGGYGKYRWQGGFIEADEGEHYARVRLEEEQAAHARTHAHTRLRAIAPGYLFTLKNCPRQTENRTYLVIGVNYCLQEGGYATGSSEARYDFNFVTQPASLPFRAPSVTRVPKATGPQTAVVVGPAGQEIWTDQYGRVKLQFRWDRYGKRDENSSCWVRVSDAWAGTNYGGIHIPRIGQEVVVDFLNGELDRPLVTGRIYNADQMPPFALPEAATQSGFLTRTPGGTAANANMLRFEDKPGAEQINIHAERDYALSVENDVTQSIGRNKAVAIANNTTVNVGGSSVNVIEGNSTMIVAGTQTVIATTAVDIFGTAVSLVGSDFASVGSSVGVVGSAVHAVGSSISAVGSSISSVGTTIGSVGMSVSTTGMSVHHVGYSVTF